MGREEKEKEGDHLQRDDCAERTNEDLQVKEGLNIELRKPSEGEKKKSRRKPGSLDKHVERGKGVFIELNESRGKKIVTNLGAETERRGQKRKPYFWQSKWVGGS